MQRMIIMWHTKDASLEILVVRGRRTCTAALRSWTREGEDPGPICKGGRRQGGRKVWGMDSSHSADCREKGGEGGERARRSKGSGRLIRRKARTYASGFDVF